VDHAHPAASELFDNAAVRMAWPIMSGESYLDETFKSMKTAKLAASSGRVGGVAPLH
jgi:hypothetical protein